MSHRSEIARLERATIVGLNIPKNASERQWREIGKTLAKAERAIQWWIGDWLRFGERKWGHRYDLAQEITGLSPKTLREYAYVSGAFDLSIRMDKLSFFHHQVAAPLPEPERSEVLVWAKSADVSVAALRHEIVRRRAFSGGIPELAQLGEFSVLLADPPWRYEFSKSQNTAIENQYPTMTLDEICALGPEIPAASDATLFLWATSPKLCESMRVIDAWGFDYRTCMVWDKEKIGMGYYFRQQHELLLVATRGQPRVPKPSTRVGSVLRSPRRGHSEKPTEVYAILETMYPQSVRLEMFARSQREGWTPWGANGFAST